MDVAALSKLSGDTIVSIMSVLGFVVRTAWTAATERVAHGI